LRRGVKVGRDVSVAELRAGYDAVLVATGAKDVIPPDAPGSDLTGVFDGYKFLEDVFIRGVDTYLANPTYDLGKRVLVIGGGNSALDCARTALRLTGGDVTMVNRRTEAEMPVDKVLVDEGKQEGLTLSFLMAPKLYYGSDGRLEGATMAVMKLGDVDSSGRRSPVPTGETVDVPCDSVLLAVGRGPNSFLVKQAGLKAGPKNSVAVDEMCMTSVEGVYAAGDVVTGETLVVKAMAKGRDAAQRIHESLTRQEKAHKSLYDYYFTRRTSGFYYRDMLDEKEDRLPPT
ncbi:MAG TPA: FAD-dependent oxidoreductase, partial [Nitrososphaerales archaeon]|nr:FAD-dependent oxidoreductase [Nitrososphaerales archaeon]